MAEWALKILVGCKSSNLKILTLAFSSRLWAMLRECPLLAKDLCSLLAIKNVTRFLANTHKRVRVSHKTKQSQSPLDPRTHPQR